MDASVTPVHWIGDIDGGYLEVIDQSKYPDREEWLVVDEPGDVLEGLAEGAIRRESEVESAVAFAVALAAREALAERAVGRLEGRIDELVERLEATEPVGEGAAREMLGRMREVVAEYGGEDDGIVERLFEVAFGTIEEGA